MPSAAGALSGLGRPKCVGRATRARCAARVARGVANAAPGAPRLLSAPGEAPAGPKPPRAPRGRRTETRPREGEVTVGGPRAKLPLQRGARLKSGHPPAKLKASFFPRRAGAPGPPISMFKPKPLVSEFPLGPQAARCAPLNIEIRGAGGSAKLALSFAGSWRRRRRRRPPRRRRRQRRRRRRRRR